jgi:hypothetical protein
MASMRNGSGDEYFILFNEHGAAMKGFDHESAMSPWRADGERIWPGMYDRVPAEFSSFLNEPAFSMNEVTFCIWRRYGDSQWHCGVEQFPPGEDPDGSARMLKILGADPRTYKEFALDYYETDLPLPALEHVYRLEPLTGEIVNALNGALSLEAIRADAAEIGYPVSAV